MVDRPLEAKVAVVTGAGSGVGRVTAQLLAAAGSRTALIGRRLDALEETAAAIRQAGGEATPFPLDLADPASIRAGFAAIREQLGPVGILVNNAGSAPPIKNMQWMPDDQWDTTVGVNLTAVYMAVKCVLPDMLARGAGTVVTVSSLAAVRPNLLGGAPYGAAKAAVQNFMGYLRATYRNEGLRATTILPGEINTPIMDTRARPPSPVDRARMLDPEDVARVILLVCTLPARALVEDVAISPSFQRDQSGDIAISRELGRPA
ncbi:MAG TPA: SDR family oxidoreductase [Acetobacteraceae bacterium]|nr:SDR family oxidoreductase [Acetobacteraceae bacterium]